MNEWNRFAGAFPSTPDAPVDWDAITATAYGSFAKKMAHTQQNPVWHGEGDVWAHTRMVCEKLLTLPAYRAESPRVQQILFASALLHDIGKIPCTRLEDGAWTSPNHAIVGAQMARKWLWVDCGLCGTPEKQQLRETICWLVRYHMLPCRILEQSQPERRLMKIAANGELFPDFTLHRLCILSEADTLGRIAADGEASAETTRLCADAAGDVPCLHGPYAFPTAHTARAYLAGRNVWPEQPLYDDCWGTVTLLCALPGTGKDTWIHQNLPEQPMVSLDEIRKELGLSPTDNQGRVIQLSQNRCREHLRSHTPFVYNATNLTPQTRSGLIRLFEEYGAAVRIVYLETAWEEELRRNAEREAAVPESVIGSMLDKLTPPERHEARHVDWLCV